MIAETARPIALPGGIRCDSETSVPSKRPVFFSFRVAHRLDLSPVMAKNLRLYIRNGIYHVMARGNRKLTVFEDDRDRHRFVEIVAIAAERYTVEVFAESRMGNHYHMVVRTPLANVSLFMAYVNGKFAQFSNRRHGRTGHLFDGPYKPILVDDDYYLKVVLAYVVMNPVAAGFVDAPEKWKWSSYRATAGLEPPPGYLCLDFLRWAFTAPSIRESQQQYCEFVTRSPFNSDDWIVEPAMGSEEFAQTVRTYIGEKFYKAALPRSYRALHRPPLSEIVGSCTNKEERAGAMVRAHVVYGYTMAEIARSLILHPNSVSRIICQRRRKWSAIATDVEKGDQGASQQLLKKVT
jgi:putative transposase